MSSVLIKKGQTVALALCYVQPYSPSRITNYFGVQLQQYRYAGDPELHIAPSQTDQSGRLQFEECLSPMLEWFCLIGVITNS